MLWWLNHTNTKIQLQVILDFNDIYVNLRFLAFINYVDRNLRK